MQGKIIEWLSTQSPWIIGIAIVLFLTYRLIINHVLPRIDSARAKREAKDDAHEATIQGILSEDRRRTDARDTANLAALDDIRAAIQNSATITLERINKLDDDTRRPRR